MLYHQRLTDLVNGHASNERQQLVKNEVHGCNVDTKKPRRSGAGKSGGAVGEAIAGAPDCPAAVVLNIGVGGDQRGSTELGEALAVAAFDEAADDESAVDVGAGVEHSEDACDHGLGAGAVEVHGSRFGVRLSSAVPKSYHHGQPCATPLDAMPLSQSRLINPLSPSSLVTTLLR